MGYEKQYMVLLDRVLNHSIAETNKRTGHRTRRTTGTMISCALNLEWPLLYSRVMYPKIGAAELAWMLMGTQDGSWLKKHTKIWEKFEEDGILKAAYGYRWRKHFYRDQIQQLVDTLIKDPSTRQAVVFAWDPRIDGLNNAGRMKNIPCHMGFSAYIIGKRLELCVYQRSVDSIVGLPYDILLYGLLNMVLANSLGVLRGRVTILFGDTHIYDSHYEIADKMLENFYASPFTPPSSYFSSCPQLNPKWDIREITSDPDGFVEDVKKLLTPFQFADYAPKPELIL